MTAFSIGRKLVSRGVASALVASVFGVMAFTGTAAASDLCGTTVTTDTELQHDLSCAAGGIAVGADGITIDLNGHTIAGSQDPESVGMLILGRTDVLVVGPGTISGFHTGIRIDGSSGVVVDGVTAVSNGAFTPSGPPFPFSPLGDGIVVTMSSEVRLKQNTLAGNGDDGINVHMSTAVIVTENVVTNNRHDNVRLDLADGNVVSENLVTADSSSPTFPTPTICNIELFGSKGNVIEENHVVGSIFGIRLNPSGTVASTNNVVRENVVEDAFAGQVVSGGATIPGRGIFVNGATTTANLFAENIVSENPNGIAFTPADAPPTGNSFVENLIADNVCGVTGPSGGNSFDENEFVGNDSDFC